MSWESLAYHMRRWEARGIEVFLTFCSLWAAWVLLTPPSAFKLHPGYYILLRGVLDREQAWGLLALAIATVKTIGLLCDGGSNFCREFGVVLRSIGLAGSGFFWTVIGFSFLLPTPHGLSAVPLIGLGGASWWALIRFPAASPKSHP